MTTKPDAGEHVTCPNCKADVLLPPATRTVHIHVTPGEEPAVFAETFRDWELDAVLKRALELGSINDLEDDDEDDDA